MWVPIITFSLTPILTGLIIFLITSTVVKENKKVSEKYDSHYFLMRASRRIMYVLAVFGCLIDIAVVGLCVFVAFAEPYALFICVPIALILLYPFNKIMIGGIRYSLLVDGENMTYCGFWNSKQRKYIFADISYFVRKASHNQYQTVETYYAYSAENKKLFGVTSMLSCYDIFTKTVFDRGFEVCAKKKD